MIGSIGGICYSHISSNIPRAISTTTRAISTTTRASCSPVCLARDSSTYPKTKSCYHVTSCHVTSRRIRQFSTNTGIKRSVVVTKLSALTMQRLRAIQLGSHVGLVGLSIGNLSFVSYQLVTSDVSYQNFSTALSTATLILLSCPVFISCVVGRLEFNHLNKTVKASHLDLFGKRCEAVCPVKECEIIRESKLCKLSVPSFLPYVLFWKETAEETAELISVLSSEQTTKRGKSGVLQQDKEQGFVLPARLYLGIVVGICLSSLLLEVKELHDTGKLDDILSFSKTQT